MEVKAECGRQAMEDCQTWILLSLFRSGDRLDSDFQTVLASEEPPRAWKKFGIWKINYLWAEDMNL